MMSEPTLGTDSRQTTVEEDDFVAGIVTEVVHDKTQINSYQLSEADRLKEQGNIAYKDGRYSEAIQLYRSVHIVMVMFLSVYLVVISKVIKNDSNKPRSHIAWNIPYQ